MPLHLPYWGKTMHFFSRPYNSYERLRRVALSGVSRTHGLHDSYPSGKRYASTSRFLLAMSLLCGTLAVSPALLQHGTASPPRKVTCYGSNIMPTKKPRGQELTLEQQIANQALTQRRLRIEHVNSSVKRCRIVKDRIRLWKEGVRDLVMEICCALHNFRVRLTPWQPMV